MIYRTYSLETRNEAITRALVVVHGAGRDADNYFRSALATFLAGGLENTVVIAPRMASAAANCHDTLADEDYAHVHVIVNLIHPQSGLLNKKAISYSKLGASRWAEAYEKTSGKVYCEQRVQDNARRDQGEFVRYKEPGSPGARDRALSRVG